MVFSEIRRLAEGNLLSFTGASSLESHVLHI
jgi:hypothetical protein